VAGQPDPPAVRHLRNSRHCLAPGGLLDRLRLPALMVRGIVLNALTIVPYVMLLVSLTDLVYSLLQGPRRFFVSLPLAALVVFIAIVVTYPFVMRVAGRWMTWNDRNMYERLTGLVFVAAAVLLALVPVFSILDDAVWLMPSDVVQLIVVPLVRSSRLVLAAVVLVAAWILLGRWSRTARLRAAAALYAAGLLGPAVLLGLYLLLCVFVIYPPGTMGLAMDTRRPPTADEVAALNLERVPGSLVGNHMWAAAREDIPPATVGVEAEVLVIDPDRLWHLVTEGQHLIISGQPSLRFWLETPHDDPSPLARNIEWPFVGVAALWWLLNIAFVNVNAASTHGFYRDCVSRAYLIRRAPGEPESIEPSDETKLSDLCRAGARAPYHLVDASLNLHGTVDSDMCGRHSDFFVFSKRYTGGPRVGWVPTPELERLCPHLDLGTAVAVSGAAASPNAGVAMVSPLAFVVTLLDVRLGYWLPSPAAVRGAGWWRRRRLWLGTGPAYLIREAFEQADGSACFVSVSDGGHIENLAIYELLRRRCRLIIAVDGEQDQPMVFDGLMRLLLYARIDLGVDIDIDLSALRRADSGWSSLHYAIGTIAYGATPDGHRDTGVLLYLKASMTGDEDEAIGDYRRSHPEFPHEPTAHRFLGERQWEMYRRLGLHVVESVLGNASDPYVRAIRDQVASLREPGPARAAGV
jgi:hypothetical protein